MQIRKFQNNEEWLEARKGRITGSRLKSIISKTGTKKIGFYELIAERVAEAPDGENPMERGHRLEPIAVEAYSEQIKRKINTDLVIWLRDDDESIALSPDGSIGVTEAVEVKCLSSAKHIEAFLTQKIPSDYNEQKIQYFIVNEKLKKLHFVFFDPRIACKKMFVIIVNRKDIEDEIKFALDYQREVLEEVKTITNDLTF